ncbi:hypothetical protein [Mongoliitalea daihaiensis]|uniref:hypothetical protein n=1 Tax=Mongoliitalea daihaiensis TaxID=2782006 RepID=UPI001F196290|nr:hypothetical protein [Mongoliitalea daihaiensis]UJP66679.1 hypothetical protein IPZ59_08875 [Mongoliitalea daihaiensis]
MKKIMLFLVISFLFNSCKEFEELDGPCLVFLVADADGRERFYEIREDIRRNKSTGVFTYRDEEGKLWSISVNEEGRYFSKSTGEISIEVDRIECGTRIYNERDRGEDND